MIYMDKKFKVLRLVRYGLIFTGLVAFLRHQNELAEASIRKSPTIRNIKDHIGML